MAASVTTATACLGALGARTVELWVFRVPATLDPDDRQLLDQAERTRVERFVRPYHGAWYGGTRAEVKRIIGRRLDVAEHQVRLGRRVCPRCGSHDHGPPTVSEPPCSLTVSWSRSGDVAAIAVGGSGPLGVDVESVARVLDVDLMVRNALSPREAAVLGLYPDDAARRAVFLRCWTRKEAVLKAAGIGIVTDLSALEVYPERSGWVTVADPETSGVHWQVCDVSAGGPLPDGSSGSGLAVAVAQCPPAEGPLPAVELRRWPDPGTPMKPGCGLPEPP